MVLTTLSSLNPLTADPRGSRETHTSKDLRLTARKASSPDSRADRFGRRHALRPVRRCRASLDYTASNLPGLGDRPVHTAARGKPGSGAQPVVQRLGLGRRRSPAWAGLWPSRTASHPESDPVRLTQAWLAVPLAQHCVTIGPLLRAPAARRQAGQPGRLSAEAINHVVRRRARQAGIVGWEKVSGHSLRATGAILAAWNDVPAGVIAEHGGPGADQPDRASATCATPPSGRTTPCAELDSNQASC